MLHWEYAIYSAVPHISLPWTIIGKQNTMKQYKVQQAKVEQAIRDGTHNLQLSVLN